MIIEVQYENPKHGIINQHFLLKKASISLRLFMGDNTISDVEDFLITRNSNNNGSLNVNINV